MKKIPTLFERQHNFVVPRVNRKAEWVLKEESIPRRKYDGTCMLYTENYDWYYRRSAPLNKYIEGFEGVEIDYNTGKVFGWMPLDQEWNFYKYWLEAIEQRPLDCDFQDRRKGEYEPGTYELVGPKINGNHEGTKTHRLMPHNRAEVLNNVTMLNLHELDEKQAYEQLAISLAYILVEGVVFYGADGKMAKIKRSDFPYAT